MTEVIVPLAEVIVSPDDVEELGWQDRALCAQTDPEAFFPEKGGSTREAKRVCRSCEVRAECLDYALENDERFGIWGGMSERERRAPQARGDLASRQHAVAAGRNPPAGGFQPRRGGTFPGLPGLLHNANFQVALCVGLVLS